MEHPLSDLLNYEHFLTPGVLGLKDRAVMCAWSYLAADLEAATPEELMAVMVRTNHALHSLGTGHMLHVGLQRRAAAGYPQEGAFPDVATWLIDEERRRQYRTEGVHFDTVATLFLTWHPPLMAERLLTNFFVSDVPTESTTESLIRQLEQAAALIEDGLSDLTLVRLTDDDFVTALHRVVSGIDAPIKRHAFQDIDVLIGSYDMPAGIDIFLNNQHIRTVTITGFPGAGIVPAVMRALNTLAFPFYWSTRWIAADVTDMKPKMERIRKQWWNSIENFFRPFHREKAAFDNEDAIDMAHEANAAIADLNRGLVRYGFYTGTITVRSADAKQADEWARAVTALLLDKGFPSRVETYNAEDALIGSLPGHGYQNVRRPIIHTENLAGLLPLWSIWPGEEENPSPKFPPNSPPLCYAKTTGHTPFRLNLHVSDVGHTLIDGTTGFGKSMLLSFLMAQWRRYEGAQIFCFDYGYSHEVLTCAAGGAHYNLLEDERLTLYPLAHVDNEDERRWAVGWIQWLIELQHVPVSPAQKQVLYHALFLLGQQRSRTLSEYVMLVQDTTLRDALAPYTLTGECGRFFDGDRNMLAETDFHTFELSHLFQATPLFAKALLPYVFHRIDQHLNDDRPTLIVFDEGRILQLDERLRQQYLTWLVTVRKKNGAVLLTIPSIATLLSLPEYPTILDSCPTKIWLPNPEARKPEVRKQYEQMGFTEGEIDTLANAHQKREYYVTSPLGRRLIDFDFGSAAHAFCGHNGPQAHRRVQELIGQHGAAFVQPWLQEHGGDVLATQWTERTIRLAQRQGEAA